MRLRRLFNDIINAVRDPDRALQERIFLIYTISSEISVFIALIGDVILKESIYEIIMLVLVLVFVPTITCICFYRNRLDIAMKTIVTSLVLVILPSIFLSGGGVEGGGLLWVIFAFLYAGHVLTGKWRKVMLSLIVLMSFAFFGIAYYYPQLVYHHSKEVFYLDTLLSILLVGGVCFSMTWFQNQVFMEENQRARKEAERAEELTRAQNRFFSSMSHEIRTPINSILGLNELILRDTGNPDEISRDASGIQGAGKMLLALINDILDFSKMEAGSMDIVPVDYSIADMLSEIVNMIWLRAGDKGLKLNVSIDPSVPSGLYGDEVRIKQVIVNLLNNAVKYTAKGSVELHVECSTIDEENVTLQISVSDTGMGIRKEAMPYLFDAFKRVDEEKNRHIEGTGLGLSIVKQIVDLMEGTVTVNSVYGEGTTFTVTLRQGISDASPIGELNILNRKSVRSSAYESGFRAPSARVLIVDDNEMNLEVESRLLAATEMTIDKAPGGKEALEMTLANHYDVILMDHLMPGMDGVECLENIRNQTGGLNRTSPVIVLTANAGSDNRDLYNRSGFDGHLMKPVSGEAMENTIMRFISPEKLFITRRTMSMGEDINTLEGYAGKTPVVITSTSMCDIPDSLVKKLRIPILPFRIHTDQTTFKDGVQMGADELITYLEAGKKVESSPPDDKDYTDFFSYNLRKAHHLIHIAITTGMSEDYRIASEAALAFDNVTVINSGCVSSATGLLVLIAYKLAQQNLSVEEIVSELERVKKRLKCSFIIDTTEYMARKGLISSRVDRFARALNLHPCVMIKNDRPGIGGAWTGSIKRAYSRYIRRAFPTDSIPDQDVLFITYVNIPAETLMWIRTEVSKLAYFENVVFVQASAAISSNCGPGTFGILYFTRSNKTYNIASFIDKEVTDDKDPDRMRDISEEGTEDDDSDLSKDPEESPDSGGAVSQELKWYRKLEDIDGEAALRNSGSEEALSQIIKIFLESVPVRTEEIEGFYSSGDWKNYTIKVHALKSSAKLIGAMGLAEKAQLLEDAGKSGDTGYIRENQAAFMEDLRALAAAVSSLFPKPEEEKEDLRPVADDFLMESVYDELRAAADEMDHLKIEGIINEMKDYAIPEKEERRYGEICQKAEVLDYEGILNLLGEKG
ncbi:MAG: DegV family EDD domain-containing protein [Lachnospiraceae bacterium]|nr:DegV family EDD domain-containing protein [Lachnospiraceae bacterium]